MPEYTLRIRRYDPSQAKLLGGTPTRSISRPSSRCSTRSSRSRTTRTVRSGFAAHASRPSAAPCGVRMNGKPGLACNTHLEEAAARVHGAARTRRGGLRGGAGHHRRADGQHAGDPRPDRGHGRGPLEEDPARHAVADQQGADPRARVHRPAREHGRCHPADGLHPVRRRACRTPGDGGRSAVRRAGRAGQGIPLRGRSARRRASRAPERSIGGSHGIYDCTHCSTASTPSQGRRPDEPYHAPAPDGGSDFTSRTETTADPTSTRRQNIGRNGILHEPDLPARLLRRQVPPARSARAIRGLPTAAKGLRAAK